MNIDIDIIYDLSCPWCYVGVHRLRVALQARPKVDANIHWRPFLLNPDMPQEGMDRTVYLARKFGTGNRVERMLNAVQVAADKSHLPLDMKQIEVTPNTVSAHRLITLAPPHDQTSLVMAIYDAYFVQGLDIGDRETLINISQSVGMDKELAKALLSSETGKDGVYEDNARAHRLGVNGVPCFIFADDNAISGAQESEVFICLIDMVHEMAVGKTMQSQVSPRE